MNVGECLEMELFECHCEWEMLLSILSGNANTGEDRLLLHFRFELACVFGFEYLVRSINDLVKQLQFLIHL